MSNSMIENISPKQKDSPPLSKTSTPKPENLSLSKTKPVVQSHCKYFNKKSEEIQKQG